MTFIVTGFSLRGPTLIDCDTAIGALERAAELIRTGYADVLIADGEGVQYAPSQFLRAFDL
jgi:3-oxoacyl-(acyl-carrier-protein) synthase